MKKLFIIALYLCILCGCTYLAAENDQSVIGSDKVIDVNGSGEIMLAEYIVDLSYNPSDEAQMSAHSEYAVLARVVSVDGTDSYNAKNGTYGMLYTYGRIEIINVYKGELRAGETYGFTRNGGIGTWEQYAAGRNPEALKKQEQLMKENGKTRPAYVEEKAAGDISIEEGKTYLIYMLNQDYSPMDDSFLILGYQGGLREVNMDKTEVRNNYTGEWQSLEETVSAIE